MRVIVCSLVNFLLLTVFSPMARHAESAEPRLTLTPVFSKASPGLACVVNFTIENAGTAPIEVVDVERLAFLVVDFTWCWEWDTASGVESYKLRPADVAYAVGQLHAIDPVVIPANQKREWFIVVPVPHALDEKRSARLRVTHEPRNGIRLEAAVDLALDDPVRVDGASPPDAKFVQVAIATGMESQVQGFFKTMGFAEEIKRRGFGGDEPLLLAWYCAKLYRDQFEADAWTKLNVASDQYRAIRDANLLRALKRGKIRLTQEQAESIKKQVAGAYPFSDALIEAAQKCVP